MSVDDKKKLYQEGLGRTADCRPRLEPSVGPNLRLGSLRGCNPLVWHPRPIDLAVGILHDFDFRMIVDCYAGDGAWALANIEMTHPRPYVGITMGSSHTKLCNMIVGGAVKCAMATAGHTFCSDESSALIQAVCPDIMNKLEDDQEDEYFPEDEEDDQQSGLSEGEAL